MSDEQLRIAVAEAMGWGHINGDALGGPCGCSPEQKGIKFYTPLALPNYPASLDACASFEATMTDDQWDQYRCYLMTVIYRDDRPHRDFTPRQRCLAYLATVAAKKA